MKQKHVAIIALLMLGGSVFAQNEMDAFRYSQYTPAGSARYSSLSGSMGGFGADFSVLSVNNPAGIGLFKRSEVTFTPAISFNSRTTDYNDFSYKDNKYNFNLNNLGGVLALKTKTDSKWKNIQLATGYNNLARYNSNTYTQGINVGSDGRRVSYFDHVAFGLNENNTSLSSILADTVGLNYAAWDYYLLDTLNGKYISSRGDVFDQTHTISTRGYMNEWVFSGGANYDDKFYFGVTLGIPFFRYSETREYTEESNDYYDYLSMLEEFEARGTGVNLKLGILYQPTKFIRFGAAFHTPTFYNRVKEEYYSSLLIDNFAGYNWENDYGGQGRIEYQLVTPYHVLGNLVFLIDRYAFINIDYEFVDYSTTQMQAYSKSQDDIKWFKQKNQNITNYYKGTHSVRIGGEVNLSPVMLRLGYSYTSNPYTDKIEKDGTSHIISAGIGYKSRYFFLDFAYRYNFLKEYNDIFFDATNVNLYNVKAVNQLFALTFGWKIGK